MKEKLTLRNALVWTAALALMIMFFVSFGATAKMSASIEGDAMSFTFSHAVWGVDSIVGVAGGQTGSFYIPEGYRAASVPGIIGAILFILSAGGLVAASFLIKDEKTSKIIILVCAGTALVGSILLFFVGEVVWSSFAKMMELEGEPMTPEYVKSIYGPYATYSSPYGIACGIIGILMSGAAGASQFIPDRKFIK